MAKFPRFLTLPIAAVIIVSACGGGGSAAPGGSGAAAGATITVTSLWGGSEQESFQKVLDAFKTKTGITATYQAQRTDYSTVLQSKITSGSPPDVAIMPGLGFLRQFARSGGIKKVSDLGIDPASLEGNYPPGILDPGKVDGELYGIMVKFNSKSTFWYRPDKLSAAGATQLLKSQNVEEQVSRAQSCRAKLDVLEIGIKTGQIDAPRATSEYMRCVEESAPLNL